MNTIQSWILLGLLFPISLFYLIRIRNIWFEHRVYKKSRKLAKKFTLDMTGQVGDFGGIPIHESPYAPKDKIFIANPDILKEFKEKYTYSEKESND